MGFVAGLLGEVITGNIAVDLAIKTVYHDTLQERQYWLRLG